MALAMKDAPATNKFTDITVESGHDAPTFAEVAAAPVRFVQPHRASVVDIDEIGGWLIGRLRERFPQHSDRVLKSWLIGCTNDNECLFLRAAGAVIMAIVMAMLA